MTLEQEASKDVFFPRELRELLFHAVEVRLPYRFERDMHLRKAVSLLAHIVFEDVDVVEELGLDLRLSRAELLRGGLSIRNGAEGRDRTTDTTIFNHR